MSMCKALQMEFWKCRRRMVGLVCLAFVAVQLLWVGRTLFDMTPEELSQEGAPGSYDPSAGDVTVYGPWGNIAIFYQDFRDSAGLIPIGHIDAGLEVLSGQDGDFTATLERAA